MEARKLPSPGRDDRAHAQAYLAAVVESSDDAIITKDLDGVITSANAAAYKLFEYEPDELIGQSVRILIPPDRQSEEDEILSRIRRGDRIDHFETIRLTKHGRELSISLTVSPVRDEHGTIIGISKTARDVTERKRLADELAAQREWFRVTLESIGDAVIATDIRGHVVFMNPIAEDLTGWMLDAARDRPCAEVFQIVNEHTRRAVENPITRVLKHGTVVGLANHTVLIAADGTERPIDDSGAPIRNRQGDLIGAVLVFRDISERRHLEADREAANHDRERLLVAERTARGEAERANRLKDDFVAMVSHELRTPLNAILGWTDLIRKGRNDPAVVERGLGIIARNTRLQSQLISDLLDISRIVSGKLRLELQIVDLAAVVNNAIDTVQHTADDKQVEIERVIDTDLEPMAADPARLEQIIWNLVSNAVKFTPRGGHVRVSAHRAGSRVEIAVEDDGAGIELDFLPHVFDRFQQADASRRRRFGGLGLGLSIVKSLVDFHGGTVLAQSDGEGHGAIFTVSLPVAVPPDLRDQSIAPARVEYVADVSLANLRLLLVEDEPDAAEFVVRLLRGYGATVMIAASASEALELFESARPDILISDIGLPDVDGYQLMEQIRKRSVADGGTIPAVALTAFARSEDRTRAMRAGYQAHLSKPIEPSELVAAVASFADLVKARRNAAGAR